MKILIFIIALFLTLECQLFNFPKDSLVRLQNDSNFDIKIAVFEKGNLVSDTIYLEKGKYLERKIHPRDSFEPYLPIVADSITIKFANHKVLIQSCNREPLSTASKIGKCNIVNNLLNTENGIEEVFSSGKYERRVTYKITQFDYNRAVNL
jgi:hypothetical protein